MERFFDGMDQENSKTQGGKGQIRKFQKNKKERMEQRKRRDFYIHGGSHTRVCSPSIENTLRQPPSCDPPSREPSRIGTSPTTKHKAIFTKMLYVYVKMFQSPIYVSVF